MDETGAEPRETRLHGVDLVHGPSLVERTLLGVLTVLVESAHRLPGASPAGVEAGPLACALADRLAASAPSPDLAAFLDTLDPAGMDDDALVEGIAAWDRILAWVSSRQGELVAAFTAREDSSRRLEFAADAIATRLAITRAGAEAKVDLAAYLNSYPDVAELLAAGEVDAYKVKVIGEELTAAPRQAVRAILDDVLPRAPHITGPQLRARIRKAALAVDPAAAQTRAVKEADRRCVRLTPAPDAMAYLTFYLPADDATACLTALDAIAAMASPEDLRPIDARRADALTDLLRSVLDAGCTPGGLLLPTQQRRRPHIQVTVAASTLLGLDEAPGELAGYGPIPAWMARTIAADGTWRRILLDGVGNVTARGDSTYRPGVDLTGTVIARDGTCRFPGCRIPAWRCDLDHIEPFDPNRPADEQTTRDNLQALCRHHHRLKTETPWKVARNAATGQTRWTTPWGREYVCEPHHPPGPIRPAPPARPDKAAARELRLRASDPTTQRRPEPLRPGP